MEGTQFTVLVHLEVQFTTGKSKILLKTKISAKAVSLVISNNVSPRPQKNHIILVKLSNINIFSTQIATMGLHQSVIRSSHIAYNKTIHLYFLDAKFQLLGICSSWLYPEETTSFFWFRTQLHPFCV